MHRYHVQYVSVCFQCFYDINDIRIVLNVLIGSQCQMDWAIELHSQVSIQM